MDKELGLRKTKRLLELTHIAGLDGLTVRLELESWNGKFDALILTAIPTDPAYSMKCGLGIPIVPPDTHG